VGTENGRRGDVGNFPQKKAAGLSELAKTIKRWKKNVKALEGRPSKKE